MVAFQADINEIGPTAFNKAQCMQEPTYTVTTDDRGQTIYGDLSPLTSTRCDMQPEYRGFPRQLFRVERANFTGTDFVPSNTGGFTRIIHRPTGYAVAPSLLTDAIGRPNLNLPIPGAPLQLLPLSTGNNGYWWLLVPYFQDPTWIPGAPIRLIARPQAVFVPRPALVPSLVDAKAMWSYLTAPGQLVVSPQTDIIGVVPQPLITKQYLVVNANAPPEVQAASKLASTQLLDYSIMGLITRALKSFDFNGAFPPSATT
ncbi:Hypothetical protein POVN_LOCUS56 [uncultured virus]|nr:Hypothetical protein POVN_LOCUS56 [uncultured virus]